MSEMVGLPVVLGTRQFQCVSRKERVKGHQIIRFGHQIVCYTHNKIML